MRPMGYLPREIVLMERRYISARGKRYKWRKDDRIEGGEITQAIVEKRRKSNATGNIGRLSIIRAAGVEEGEVRKAPPYGIIVTLLTLLLVIGGFVYMLLLCH